MLTKFFNIPVFTTEDEVEEEFSPKAKKRASVPNPRDERLKVSFLNIMIFILTLINI